MNVMYAALVYVKNVQYATVRYAPHAMNVVNVANANVVEDPVVIMYYVNIVVGVLILTPKPVLTHRADAVRIEIIRQTPVPVNYVRTAESAIRAANAYAATTRHAPEINARDVENVMNAVADASAVKNLSPDPVSATE